MERIGITLVFVFIAFCGWQIFKRSKKNEILNWVDKIGGIFWILLGIGGAIIMIIKILVY